MTRIPAIAVADMRGRRAPVAASGLPIQSTPCGPYDTLIGAHARSKSLILVTSNRREFDRMPGLRVENWV